MQTKGDNLKNTILRKISCLFRKESLFKSAVMSDNAYNTICRKAKNKMYFQYLIVLSFLLILMFLPISSVQAAANLKLYYNGKNVDYTGAKVTYKLDGKQLSQSAYPGIILSGTSLVSGYDVFNNSYIDLNYAYSSKTNKVTFKKDYTTVEMTLGSKTAYINGVKTNVSVAPIMVKYRSKGKSKVLVPARFVAEAFGYSYSWNSSRSVATLSKPSTKFLNLYYDNKWNTYQGTKGKVTIDGKSVNVSTLPSIIMNQTTLVQAYKVFAESSIKAAYKYDSTSQNVTLSKGDNEIILTLGSKKAMVNGKSKTMDEAPRLVKNKANNKSYVMVPGKFVAENLGYNYVWSGSAKTSIITTPKITVPPSDDPEDDWETEAPDVSEDPDETEGFYVTYGLLSDLMAQVDYLKNLVNEDIVNPNGTPANIISIEQENVIYPDKMVYTVTSNFPLGNISSVHKDENTIKITLGNTKAEDKIYLMENSIVKDITASYSAESNSTELFMGLNNPNAKYSIELSGGNTIMKVSVYYNYISEVITENTMDHDIITINGVYTPNPSVTSDDTFIYLDFANTMNGVGEQSTTIEGEQINELAIMTTGTNMARLTITKQPFVEYSMEKVGDSCIITLTSLKSEDEPVVKPEKPAKPDSNIKADIKIAIPSNVNSKQISNTDMYYKNQFKITIPGNQKSFYDANPVSSSNSVISNIKASVNSAGNTELLVTTKKLQGYKITEKGSYLYVVVGDPRNIYDKIVVLDAGHGGTDPGAMHGGYKEKDLNYKILYTTLKSYFDNNSDIKAYWSRYDDTFISLSDRAAFAKKVGADFFISLHMNAASSSAAGTEIYYSKDNNKNTASGLNSKNLASTFISKLTKELGSNNRGVKENGLYVCKNNTVPAILIELGFMTNSTELKNLTNTTYQNKAAKAIYESIETIFNQYSMR